MPISTGNQAQTQQRNGRGSSDEVFNEGSLSMANEPVTRNAFSIKTDEDKSG
jgi:hypothetical protein